MASSDPTFTVAGVKSLAGAGDTEGAVEAAQMLNNFWQTTTDNIRNLTMEDFKTQELPLARIKKIMKLDDDVKMISAEAPMLFAKAAEIFISELSLRAWIHTEDNKRRTLQKNDIAMAVTKYDQFDFLIDIVPRDELKPTRKSDETVTRTSMVPDQVRYYLQLAQQHQAALQQQQQQPQAQAQAQQPQTQQIQIQTAGGQVLQQPLQIQLAGGTATQGNILQVSQVGSDASQPQTQVIQVQAPSQPQQQQQQQQQTTQVFQQIISPSGEVQNVPIQLTQEQIQALTAQMQGKQPGQPIMIQTAQPQLDQQQEQMTQPLFQVPLNTVGGQQIFLQQAIQEGQDTDGIQITHAEVPS